MGYVRDANYAFQQRAIPDMLTSESKKDRNRIDAARVED